MSNLQFKVYPSAKYAGPNYSGAKYGGQISKQDYLTPASDWVDYCCQIHDIAYTLAKTVEDYKVADEQLVQNIQKVKPLLNLKLSVYAELIQKTFQTRITLNDYSYGAFGYLTISDDRPTNQEDINFFQNLEKHLIEKLDNTVSEISPEKRSLFEPVNNVLSRLFGDDEYENLYAGTQLFESNPLQPNISMEVVGGKLIDAIANPLANDIRENFNIDYPGNSNYVPQVPVATPDLPEDMIARTPAEKKVIEDLLKKGIFKNYSDRKYYQPPNVPIASFGGMMLAPDIYSTMERIERFGLSSKESAKKQQPIEHIFHPDEMILEDPTIKAKQKTEYLYERLREEIAEERHNIDLEIDNLLEL